MEKRRYHFKTKIRVFGTGVLMKRLNIYRRQNFSGRKETILPCGMETGKRYLSETFEILF